MVLPTDWTIKTNHLLRVFRLKDFLQAVHFVNKIVDLAEKHRHHPDIEIFGYNQVRIRLTTHDQNNQVTKQDLRLATEINKLYTKYRQSDKISAKHI